MKLKQIYTDEIIKITSAEQLATLKPLYTRKQKCEFICSKCHKTKIQLLKFLNENICCRHCCASNTLEKTLGVTNVFQLEKVKNKIKKTKKTLIVEIKGPHFFQRWKMICPWRYKNDTPDKIEWRNGLFEAKHQCMIKNNVKIITDIFEYIEELKYGL